MEKLLEVLIIIGLGNFRNNKDHTKDGVFINVYALHLFCFLNQVLYIYMLCMVIDISHF